MSKRNEYVLGLIINGKKINRVIIDQHYKKNHKDISDELILKLVATLNGGEFDIEMKKGVFEYFVVEPVFYEFKVYRLVLLLCIHDNIIDVINAFRVKGSF